MPSLHNLTNDALALLNAVLEASTDEEAASALEANLADTLEKLDAKIERCLLVADEMEREAESIRKIAQEYAARAKTTESRALWLKQRVLGALQAVGMEEVKTEKVRAKVALGPPAVILDENIDIDLLPSDFVKVERSIVKSAVKDAILTGESFPWARLEQRPMLRVRL